MTMCGFCYKAVTFDNKKATDKGQRLIDIFKIIIVLRPSAKPHQQLYGQNELYDQNELYNQNYYLRADSIGRMIRHSINR